VSNAAAHALVGFAICMIAIALVLWGAGRWLKKLRTEDEPWLAQTELWDRLDKLVSEAEAEGCRIWNENGRIRFGGNNLTARANAILIVLEKHHDDTLVVLANRKS
jgi:hypothetical protein